MNAFTKIKLFLTLIFCIFYSTIYSQDLSKIYGKIKIVEHFPDYKVKIVDNFADIEVKIVEHFPDEPGKWQIVDNFPDYKIQYVNSFPDFTVKFVTNFPEVTRSGKAKTIEYLKDNIYGKIKIVTSGEDYKVKKSNSSFADLSVKIVTSRPQKGEWEYVTSSEDYKIKFVTSDEDFTVNIKE